MKVVLVIVKNHNIDIPCTVIGKLAYSNMHKGFSNTDYRYKIQQCVLDKFSKLYMDK